MRHLLYIGCLLLLAYPAMATIVVFGHHQGLSGQSTSQPGDQIKLYEVRLVNDGNSSLQAITLTLSDLSSATGITASAITQLSLYKSNDAVFDAQSDSLTGTQTVVNIGAPTTISLTAPLTWSSGFPYFLVVATFNSTHTDEPSGSKDAFRVGSASGAIQTSSGNIGNDITADDADRHTIDVIASQMTFATLPNDAMATNGDVVSGQAFATQPIIEARDANGNVDIDATGSATISVQSGSVSLSGTTSQSWSNGRATFTNLAATSIADATAFTLQTSASGLSAAISPSLTCDVVASQLVFSQEAAHSGVPNGDVLSGVAFQTQPIVRGQDATGAVDLHFQDQVTLTSATGTLAGTTTVQAQNGLATFADVAYEATADQESFQLVADDQPSGSGGDLAAKTATAKTADIVATQIAFTTAPSDPAAANGDVVSGQPFSTQPVVEAQNAAGQRDLNFTGTATLSLPPGNPTLSGTLSETWISGRADFAGNNLQVTATADATTFALQAQSSSLAGQSTTLTADAIATQIAFVTTPSDPAATNGDIVNGQVFATQPVVEARDGNGVADIHYQGTQINISVQSGSVSLSGTTSQSWSNGRATFTNLAATSIADATAFTLQTSASGLSAAISPSLTCDVVASQLVFSQEAAHSGVPNGDVLSGVAFQTQPIVRGQDATGAVDLHFQDQVTLTSATGTLAGTTTVQAQNGLATFADVAYEATADQESFQLVADDQPSGSGGDLAAKTATAKTADIVATQIAFTTAPSDPAAANGDVVSGQPFSTQPVVEAQNAAGQRDLNFTGTATLSLASGGISLSGTTGVAFTSGRADFSASGLKAQATTDGATFALKAQAPGLSDLTGTTLTADAIATQIAFVTTPSDPAAINGDIVNGQVFATQPVVEAQDQNGVRDLHLSGTQATLSVASGAAVLSGATSQTWNSGLASFSGLSAAGGQDGETFALKAATTGLQEIQTNLVCDVVATRLAFTTQPAHSGSSTLLHETSFETQPIVEAQDQSGARDHHATGQVALSVQSGNAALAGQTTRDWSAGRADFSQSDLALSANSDGENVVLKAEFPGLPAAYSDTLNVDIRATRLVFATTPRIEGVYNSELTTGSLRVEARHQAGQLDTEFSSLVTIKAVWPDTDTPASGPLTAAPGLVLVPGAGAATYSSISYPQAGRIQLLATSPGLESARSPTITLTGSLTLAAPSLQIEDQLAFQRDIAPELLPLFAFQATPIGESLALDTVTLRIGLGAGMHASDIDSLHLWHDQGAIGQLDLSDRRLAAVAVTVDSLARFVGLTDTLHTTNSYLVTWSARSALATGWTLQGRLAPEDFLARSSQASGAEAPVTGPSLNGAQHLVGDTGPPYRILLGSANTSLTADEISRTTLEATIVDAQNRPIPHERVSTVTFSMLSGPAFIDGPVSVRVDNGRASTQLKAGGTSGSARVLASAPGLLADTLDIGLLAGPVAAIELSGALPSIQLDETDRVELSALLQDARGNRVDHSDNQVLFTLSGPGSFAAGLSTVVADSGIARTIVSAAEPGTLHVEASVGGAVSSIAIPVISTQPPYLTLNASRQNIPADGSIATRLSAVLRDPRGQLLGEDDSTPVRFSLIGGHGLLDAEEVIARGGLASVDLRGLGIAGPLTVRAEATGLESAQIELYANAAAPHRIDVVALPATIVADRNSTAVLSAVIRDSLGNIVVDSAVEVRFSIDGDRAEIVGPQTATAEEGNARTTLRSSIRSGEVEITATVPGLVSGRTRLHLIAGPAAKIQLRATPTALPADVVSTSQLTAEILDVHGNKVSDDSATAISFSVSGGPGKVLDPDFALTADGQASALLQSTGSPGKILVFAGASGLAPATFEIPVRQAQVPRFTDELAPLKLVEDGPAVRLDLSALATDGDSGLESLRFTATSDSSQIRLEVEGSELIVTPISENFWGNLLATLTVRDPTGLESSALLPIAVQPHNDPPLIVSSPDSVVTADSLFVYRLIATDADDDPLTFSLLEGPQGMAFDRALHRAVWRTPSPGIHPVVFAVSDGEATSLQRFRIRVGAADSGLRFTSQPATRARRGQLYTYQPQVENATGGSLTYALATGPRRMHVDSRTGMLTWISTDSDPALLDVALQVSSDDRQQIQRFQIRLVEGNIAPAILSTPAAVAWIDSLYIYSLQATDADGDTLVYTIAEGPSGMRINPLIGLVAWAPEEDDIGMHEIVLNAYDGREATVQRYQIEVRRPGFPPQIGPLKGLAFAPDSRLSAQIELNPLVTDPDHADRELNWSFARVSGDPISIDYDPAAQTVRFDAITQFSTARIRLTVRDPDGHTAERVLRLGLREGGDFNGDATIDLDDFFRFVDAFGTDADADAWEPTADLNGDGQVDFDDFFVFIERFEKNNAPPSD